MEMSQELMKALLDAFDASDWQEMTVTIGEDRLHVSRRADGDAGGFASAATSESTAVDGAGFEAAEPTAAAGPTPENPAAEDGTGGTPGQVEELPRGSVIESPSVGLFWRAPSPGAPPFIETGQAVSEGDTLAIVEVMKLMNHVTATVGGVVAAILPENGEHVQHRQPLVVIDPEG
jgi:acetyl-CoA carboxylase biotin carboxyl carrier protein